MTRTYSFDHYLAQTAKPRRRRSAEAKARVAQSKEADVPPKPPLAYGQVHAKTRELYQAHRRPKRAASGSAPRAAQTRAGFAHTSIGALPTTEEVYVGRALQKALGEAGRQARALRSAARELARASSQLTRLPWVVGRDWLRRLLQRGSRVQRA